VWASQPTITSASLFAVAYHGGSDTWIAGRGGAILRRTTSLATVSLPTPKLPPLLRGGSKVKIEDPEGDPDDIPRARPQLKPQKP